MICSGCDQEKKAFARGLCQACYYRLRRNGTVERKNVQNRGGCSEAGCDGRAFAKGLCQRHYDAAQHPMKGTWKLLRSRHPGEYPAEWDRFDVFLSAVGERPSPQSQIRRVDTSLAWSAENAKWIEPLVKSQWGTRDSRRAYERRWRFDRRFGISPEDYDRMLAEQNGVCAICREPPTRVSRKQGKTMDLAVDHDHATGAVRALLCTDCNTAAGLLKDSPLLARAVADYLELHAAKRRCDHVAA